jgi:hypothetical protein
MTTKGRVSAEPVLLNELGDVGKVGVGPIDWIDNVFVPRHLTMMPERCDGVT